MSFRSLASLRVAVSFAALLVLSACSDNRQAPLSAVETIDVPTADPGAQANQNIANPVLVIPDTFPVSEGDELTLVFNEEFDGPEIDPNVWFFATGDGAEKGLVRWGNNELQYYLPDNAQIVNGVLEITARRETVGDFDYTSARINTEDRFAFKYGRIEASIKMPSGQGLWPAFWMLSQDSNYVCGVDAEGNDRPCVWAATGEIDIVEAVNLDGTGGNEIFGTIHYGGEFPANQSTETRFTPGVDVTDDFNTYALEWDVDEIRWYFNGELYAMQNSWSSAADGEDFPAPFNQNFHILLNLAVGGNFPGDPNGVTPFPATMEVDWVRVYSGEDPSGGVAIEPNASAPTPTEDPATVISLFSDAYDDIAGIDYNPNWSQSTVVTIAQIAGNEMLRYGGLDYQGTDFASNPQDVSEKEYLHLDFWTADSTALNVYLISPGSETPYALPVTPNSWVSVNIPLTEFAGVDLTNVIQLKFDGNGTIFLDNLYFGGQIPKPAVGAPAPTQDPADVISLYSDAYTNIAVTWPTVWSEAASVTDVTIDGGLVKRHLGVNFVGVEFVTDASAMTHLHVDVWTPDADSLLLKLVDFGGDGFEGAAADTSGALTLDSPPQGEWVSLDIPLAEFQAEGLASLADLNQLVIDPAPDGSIVYADNVYFYDATVDADHGAGTGGVFTETTTESVIDVVSITNSIEFFGNDTVADPASTAIPAFEGDVSLSITYNDSGSTYGGAVLNFGGIDLTAYDTLNFTIDTSGITDFADLTIQIEPPGAGADGTKVLLSSYTPVATSGNWATYAIPLSDFPVTDLANAANLGFWNPVNSSAALVFGVAYVDDIYFSTEGGSGGGDHGAGTGGVFTETTTESVIDVVSITNSIEFFGNDTVADPASTAIPAFEGDVSLSITYNDSGSTYGGAVLNFGGIDLTAYDTLNFTIDTSGITDFADLTIQIEPPGAGADGTKVLLSSYTPVATSGNWATYAIPLSDFPVTDLANAANLGFWNPVNSSAALVFGVAYVDDIYFSTEGGSGGGDHGAGTGGVFTETTTESVIDVVSITNSIEFFGNDTVADPASTAIPAFEGDVSLSITYNDSGSTYGGAVLNFGGIDLTAYDTLNFTIDTSGITDFADLTIQIEPPGAGADGTKVLLSSYTPVATSGNWATYAIPLSDFPVTDLANAANLGFWNPVNSSAALVFGVAYVDDIYFSTEGGSGGGDHGAGTGGVFTETTTESVIDVVSITNSIEFFGNDTVADPASTAIPAFEGDVSLSITYNDSGSTYGGAVLNFGGIDLTAYDTLNFTIDTSGITDFADLTIQIEPPGAGADGTKVLLSSYTPVATSGNWATYAIPLSDFPVTDLANAANLGFWNPVNSSAALVFGVAYVDDIYFSTEGGSGGGDHGAGTGGVFTETTTESVIDVVSITNSIEFFGNDTVADPASTAIPAFEGDVSLSITYNDSGSTYGGAVLNFGGIDLTAYDTLNFTIDTSGITDFADLTIQIEPPGAGADGTKVLLSSYTPVATSGNWATYAIPLSDFPVTDLANAANLGFWNPVNSSAALVFGVAYVDDIYFSTEGGSGGGELAVNGDFETGSFDGWTQFVNSGVQSISGDTPTDGGSFSAALSGNTAPGAGGTTEIKQANLGSGGALSVGDVLTIRFQVKGTFGPGGQLNVLSFTEFGGGGADLSNNTIISGGVDDWTQYDYDVTLSGGDASGGFSLAFNPVCGAVTDCIADVLIDNVSVTTN